MKIIAVTGAGGFIARHVMEALAGRARIVAVVRDRSSFGRCDFADEIVEADLYQEGVRFFEKLKRPDVLLHLAWGGLPNFKSLHHFEEELPRQYAFLKEMLTSGLQSLFVAGTCFEYGLQEGQLKETAPTLPVTSYGFAKDTLRKQLLFLQANHKFNLTWGRIFYVYGPGQAKSSLLSLAEAAIQRGDPVFKMSRGEQLRDYLPVEKLAQHIATLALQEENAGCINICSGEPISIRRLVEDFITSRRVNLRLELGAVPYNDYEPLAFWGDASLLTSQMIGESRVLKERASDIPLR